MTSQLWTAFAISAALLLGLSPLEGRAQASEQWWAPVSEQHAAARSATGPAATASDRRTRGTARREERRHTGPAALHVPKGHHPPPGQCRLWFPNRPPGHQPPPTSCRTAYRTARPPAVVVTHRGPVRPHHAPHWRARPDREVVFRRSPRREGVSIRVDILIDILGRRGVQRLEEHRRRLALDGTLSGRWVSTDRSGGGVLQVRAGTAPLAELVDRTGDGHAETVYLRESR